MYSIAYSIAYSVAYWLDNDSLMVWMIFFPTTNEMDLVVQNPPYRASKVESWVKYRPTVNTPQGGGDVLENFFYPFQWDNFE